MEWFACFSEMRINHARNFVGLCMVELEWDPAKSAIFTARGNKMRNTQMSFGGESKLDGRCA